MSLSAVQPPNTLHGTMTSHGTTLNTQLCKQTTRQIRFITTKQQQSKLFTWTSRSFHTTKKFRTSAQPRKDFDVFCFPIKCSVKSDRHCRMLLSRKYYFLLVSHCQQADRRHYMMTRRVHYPTLTLASGKFS
jgi:hypothetical protein